MMISIFTGSIGLFVAVIIFSLVRADQLHAHHGASWIVIALCFALLGFSPEIFDYLALKLGVGYPPILAVLLCVIALTIKALLADIERSRIKVLNQRLIQRIAMIETDLRALKDSKHTKKSIGE